MASLAENALDFTLGRAQDTLGHGLLLWDGAAEGGSRGGYWSNARKAFGFAAIARFKPDSSHRRNLLFEDETAFPKTKPKPGVRGANYEFRPTDTSSLGVTDTAVGSADPRLNPFRDGLTVLNLRAYTSPLFISREVRARIRVREERNDDFFRVHCVDRAGGTYVRHGVVEAEDHVSVRIFRRRRSRDASA